MKKISIIQWFIALFRKGMTEYDEDKHIKEKLYSTVKQNKKSNAKY